MIQFYRYYDEKEKRLKYPIENFLYNISMYHLYFEYENDIYSIEEHEQQEGDKGREFFVLDKDHEEYSTIKISKDSVEYYWTNKSDVVLNKDRISTFNIASNSKIDIFFNSKSIAIDDISFYPVVSFIKNKSLHKHLLEDILAMNLKKHLSLIKKDDLFMTMAFLWDKKVYYYLTGI